MLIRPEGTRSTPEGLPEGVDVPEGLICPSRRAIQWFIATPVSFACATEQAPTTAQVQGMLNFTGCTLGNVVIKLGATERNTTTKKRIQQNVANKTQRHDVTRAVLRDPTSRYAGVRGCSGVLVGAPWWALESWQWTGERGYFWTWPLPDASHKQRLRLFPEVHGRERESTRSVSEDLRAIMENNRPRPIHNRPRPTVVAWRTAIMRALLDPPRLCEVGEY